MTAHVLLFLQESTYTPQVEAISPTMPNDPRDESPLRSTKDDLLKHIEQVDREIAKVSRAEQGRAGLGKVRQDSIVKSRGRPQGRTEYSTAHHRVGHSSAQVIYSTV